MIDNPNDKFNMVKITKINLFKYSNRYKFLYFLKVFATKYQEIIKE